MAWIAALIGAAGSVGGSLIGSSNNRRQSGPALTSIANNPLYQQLALMSMLQTGGRVSPAMMRDASPLGTLLSGAQDIGLKRRGQRAYASIQDNLYRQIQDGISQGLNASQIADTIESSSWWNPGSSYTEGALGSEENWRAVMDPAGLFGSGRSASVERKKRGRRVFNRLLSASGYTNLDEFVQAQMDFESQIGERTQQHNAAAETSEQGRLEAIRRIAGIQAGFVAPSEEELLAQSGEMETALRGQIAREASDQQNALSVAAQVGRYNPGGGMGRIGEWQSQANLGAGPDAMARTLQLLSGQQSLQSNALGALQGSLAAQDSGALSLLGLLSGNQIANNQIAAQMAGVNANVNAQNAQLLSQGINQGVGGIANSMLLNQLLGQNSGGSGGLGFNNGNAPDAQTLQTMLTLRQLGTRP